MKYVHKKKKKKMDKTILVNLVISILFCSHKLSERPFVGKIIQIHAQLSENLSKNLPAINAKRN